MKNIKWLLSAFVVGAMWTMQSCTELDDRIYSEIVEAEYEPTPLDGLAKIGSAYTPLKGLYVRLLLGMSWDTDQIFCPVKPWGWTYAYQLFNHNYTSTSPEIDGAWNSCYSGINSCNRTIYELQKEEPAEDTQMLIKELEALRSFYYWHLCDLYGNVAWSIKYNGEEDYLPEQITRADLAKEIEGSLKASLPYLYTDVSSKTYGRYTKWCAYATLAKLYLNWGVYVYGDGDQGRWADCVEMCDFIIESGNFGLTNTQKEIFVADNDFCKEAVMAVVFDERNAKGLSLFTTNCNGQHAQTYQITGGWGNGGSIMVPQFIDTFHPEDKRLKENYLYGPQYDNEGNLMKAGLGSIAGQDFIIVNEVLSCEGSSGDNCTENMGYRLAKYEYEMGLDGDNMNNDVFPLRYADVLLMKAECLLRMGRADEAAEIVTKVRRRSFSDQSLAVVSGEDLIKGSCYAYGRKEVVPSRGKYPKNADGTWKYTMSDAGAPDAGGDDIVYGRFLDELGWEFDQEAHRRSDLIRFKTTSGQSVWIAKSWSSHKATNDANRELYPIPLKETQANPNLKQNPGY
ncbi:MAG: RagB/SusD family nutrient uptake outer membrane protein [Muribaculaceae bacterium]|nr:RagB/SusD family nutrient uptake outer membrane protein [Muribaculaceae bacterium]